MTFVYDKLGELESVVRVFVVIVMFAEPHAEMLAGLTDIFLVARETSKLVHSIFIIFVHFLSLLHIKKFAQVVVGSIGHFYIGISEKFCDVPCFPSNICKFCLPFLSVVLFLFYFIVVDSTKDRGIVFIAVDDLFHGVCFYLFFFFTCSRS